MDLHSSNPYCLRISYIYICFHVLAIVNNAAMNMGLQIISLRFCFQFFGVYIQKVELLDHVVVFCLIFSETAILFSATSCTILHSHQ